jgi:hypothetical protein
MRIQTIKSRLSILLFFCFFIFTGLEFKAEEVTVSKENETTVCVTRTGKKYHKCYHYAGSNTEISLKEAKQLGYTPCGVCKP